MLSKKNLYTNQKILFKLLKSIVKIHPYFVVIILHEYFRNIFPFDPHIKFKTNDPFKRINNLQVNCISLVRDYKKFGSYKIKFKKNKLDELKTRTGKVYEKLFGLFDQKENLRAKGFIKNQKMVLLK